MGEEDIVKLQKNFTKMLGKQPSKKITKDTWREMRWELCKHNPEFYLDKLHPCDVNNTYIWSWYDSPSKS